MSKGLISQLTAEEVALMIELVDSPANIGFEIQMEAIIRLLDGEPQKLFRDLYHAAEWLAFATSQELKEKVRYTIRRD